MIHAIEPTQAKNFSFECNRPFISDLIIQEKSVGDTAAAAAKKIVWGFSLDNSNESLLIKLWTLSYQQHYTIYVLDV